MSADLNYWLRQRTAEAIAWLKANLTPEQYTAFAGVVIPVADPVKDAQDATLHWLGTDGAKANPTEAGALVEKLEAQGVAVADWLLPADMLAVRQAERQAAADAEAQKLGYKDAADRKAQESAALGPLPGEVTQP